MKRTLLVVILLFMPVNLFAQETVWFDGSFEAAKEKVKKEDKLVVLDFYQDN